MFKVHLEGKGGLALSISEEGDGIRIMCNGMIQRQDVFPATGQRYFQIVADPTLKSEVPPPLPTSPPEPAERQGLTDLQRRGLNTHRKQLHLRGRAPKMLENNGIEIVADMVNEGSHLLTLPHVKGKAEQKIRGFMSKHQLTFGMDLKKWRRPKPKK